MYCDTDSLIQCVDNYQQRAKLGGYLGQFTSEIPDGAKIETFIASGPKSYAYVLSNGESVLKYKGFTLSLAASEFMNIFSMRQMIIDFSKQLKQHDEQDSHSDTYNPNPLSSEIEIVVQHPRIFRIKRSMSVNTRNQVKKYSLRADKRVFFSDLSSIPYGFKCS